MRKYLRKPFRLTLPICTTMHIASGMTVLLLFLGSCRQEPMEITPSLVLQNDGVHSDSTLDAGTHFSLHILADGLGVNLTHLLIRSSGTQGIKIWLDSGFNAALLDHRFHAFKGLDSLEQWEVIVGNRNSDRNSTSFSLLLGQLNFGPVFHYPGLRLTAQSNPDTLCFLAIGGQRYTPLTAFHAQDSVDLVFYYGPDQYTMASPGANIESGIFPTGLEVQQWGIRHTAMFKETTLSLADLTTIANDSLLLAAYGAGDGKRKAKELAAGDVISFKNWDGRLGLIHINHISGQASGEVSLDIWIQQ